MSPELRTIYCIPPLSSRRCRPSLLVLLSSRSSPLGSSSRHEMTAWHRHGGWLFLGGSGHGTHPHLPGSLLTPTPVNTTTSLPSKPHTSLPWQPQLLPGTPAARIHAPHHQPLPPPSFSCPCGTKSTVRHTASGPHCRSWSRQCHVAPRGSGSNCAPLISPRTSQPPSRPPPGPTQVP